MHLPHIFSRWRQIVLVLYFLAFAAVLFSSIPLSLPSRRYLFCTPDGRPSPGELGIGAVDDNRNPLTAANLLTINVAFGSYSFGIAKFIDVIWDVVVGRGGQFVLAFIAYRVHSGCLVRDLETRPVSYRLFSALSMDSGTLHSLWVVLTESRRYKISSLIRLVSIAYSIAYVLSFPTLMGAMTGYTTKWTPYVAQDDGSMVKLASYDRVKYIIVDGSRIGLENDTIVLAAEDLFGDSPARYKAPLRQATDEYVNSFCGNGCPTGGVDPAQWDSGTNRPGYSSGDRIPVDLSGGFIMLDGKNISIPAPTLHIKPVEVGWVKERYGYLNKVPYPASQIAKNLQCKPSEDYQWGFSFALIFIIAWFNTAWIVIILSLRKYATGTKPGARAGGGLGKYRAAVDLTLAFKHELGENGVVKCSETDLKDVIHTSAHGLRLEDDGLRVVQLMRRNVKYEELSMSNIDAEEQSFVQNSTEQFQSLESPQLEMPGKQGRVVSHDHDASSRAQAPYVGAVHILDQNTSNRKFGDRAALIASGDHGIKVPVLTRRFSN